MRRRANERATQVAVVAVSVALGVALATVGPTAWQRLRDRSGAAGVQPATATTVASPPASLAPAGTAPEGPGDDPVAAVRGFLEAERLRDLRASYSYLAATDRETFGSAEAWVADHADLLPRVIEASVGTVESEGSRALVSSEVRFQPVLDAVNGLTPGRAAITWVVVREEAGWSIDLQASEFEPLYPADDGAPAAAHDWVTSAVGCQPTMGYGGTLLGRRSLAEELCDAPGDIAVGPVGPLDHPVDARAFVSEFGADVTSWARVISVEAPVELRVVVAPIGDDWTVIGVLPPTTQ